MASKVEETIPMEPTAPPQQHVVVVETSDETTPCCCCCDDGCEEENEERGNWSCNFESILASISFAVGPGYLWVMPYLIYVHGGLFLLGYFFSQIFVAFPIVYLEMALGQYTSQGPIRALRGVPILQGIGVGMVVMSAIFCIYHNGFMAEMLYYMFYVPGDLSSTASCDNYWNTPSCKSGCVQETVEYDYGYDAYNYTRVTCGGVEAPAMEYRLNYVLQLSTGITDMGAVRGPLAGCLFLAWLLVVLGLSFGVKSLGKVAYVTTLVPMFFIFILFLRAVTLPGGPDGIAYLLWPSLGSNDSYYFSVITAIVHRLGVGHGGYTTLSSHNRFHNNVLRDAVVVILIDFLMVLLCAMMIFGFLGFLSHQLGVPITEVATSGPNLVYVAMVTVFSHIPAGSSWAALFFLTLVLLTYGTQLVLVETVITSLMDLIPKSLIKNLPGRESGLLSKRTMLHGVMTVAVCFLFFLLGLPYVTQGGVYLLTIVDTFNAQIQPYIFILLECVAIAYLYSPSCRRCCPALNRWMSDLSHMLQHVCCFCCATVVNGMAAVAWVYYIPMVMLIQVIAQPLMFWPHYLSYYNYVFPTWATIVGYLILSISLIVVPLGTIINIIIALVRGRPSEIVQPPADWGPYLNKHRRGVSRGQPGQPVDDTRL
ncbi:sodium- and chloride-dependent glycine transporter 2-like isoform X1 [Branchiostoma lanceolatum]|uniref:sodium- and chloride-dependent glycine transporter 2-like isoform X1 n=2 Tax=Branchiostoma lanceolatum TaxID=7740 RepID=UPI003453167D